MSPSALRVLEAPPAKEIPADLTAFLRGLGGPAWIRVPGRERERARAVATLLHGNEPSGIRALHAWLRRGERPAVDVVAFVGAVEAALAPPGFAHRVLPGRTDLNRCFRPPFPGREGALARALLERLEKVAPEALVDLHNNTGHNPPYGVTPRLDAASRRLVSLFGERMVHSRLRLGALVEATHERWPSVTVECGRAGDPAADDVALRGLERFVATPELGLGRPPECPLQLQADPIRVRAREGVRLAFGALPGEEAQLTVREDVDRHNFERLAPGTAIGWVVGEAWPLEAIDAEGREVSREIFRVAEGVLRTRREVVPIMMTTNPLVAVQDCLFYVVSELEDTP